MVQQKTVVIPLFRWIQTVFMVAIGACVTFFHKDYSVSAIAPNLISAKLRGTTGKHTLNLYIRELGGSWKKVIEATEKTVEVDITAFLKAHPDFEIRAETCYPTYFTLYEIWQLTSALELTYTAPPEPTFPPELAGETTIGMPELGQMFNFMMQMFMFMMFMSLMVSMMETIGGT